MIDAIMSVIESEFIFCEMQKQRFPFKSFSLHHADFSDTPEVFNVVDMFNRFMKQISFCFQLAVGSKAIRVNVERGVATCSMIFMMVS